MVSGLRFQISVEEVQEEDHGQGDAGAEIGPDSERGKSRMRGGENRKKDIPNEGGAGRMMRDAEFRGGRGRPAGR